MAGQRKQAHTKSAKGGSSRVIRRLEQIDAEALAARQRVQPLADPQKLFADFWPENETADQFNQAVRQWRRQGKRNHV